MAAEMLFLSWSLGQLTGFVGRPQAISHLTELIQIIMIQLTNFHGRIFPISKNADPSHMIQKLTFKCLQAYHQTFPQQIYQKTNHFMNSLYNSPSNTKLGNKTNKQNLPKSRSMLCLVQSEKNIPCKSFIGSENLSKGASNKKIGSRGLKLRDYMFQMQINSKKFQETRKNSSEHASPKYSTATSAHIIKNNSSKSEIRSGKYLIDNHHIINVVSSQLKSDLSQVIDLANSMQEQLELTINGSLTKDEMTQIFSFKRILRDKILKEMLELESRIMSNRLEREAEGQTGDKYQKEIEDRVKLSLSIIEENDELNKKSENMLTLRGSIEQGL